VSTALSVVTSTSAILVAPDVAVRARAASLLAEAGIRGVDVDTVRPPCELGDLVRRVREIVESRTGERPIAIMPADATNAWLRKVLRAGAVGIVPSSALESSLVPTARAVLAGQIAVPQTLRRHVAPRALSHREKQVLALVTTGLTNRQIADRLFLAESTVKTHLSSAFDKIDARSRAEATAMILDPDEGPALGLRSAGDPFSPEFVR
jgi:DNA-binding NarL/FixJ family response regulator